MSIVEMRVNMDCAGCESKIRKSLQKLKGVDDVDIDMNMQKVTVMGWANQEKVLKTVRKTGRTAELWPYPYNPEYHEFVHHYNYHNDHDQDRYYDYYQTEPFPVVEEQLVRSTYNYKNHGYSGSDNGYHQQPPYSTVIDEKASAFFSDENPHACSIM